MIQAAVQVPPEAGVTVVAAVVVEVRVGVGVRVRGMIELQINDLFCCFIL